MNCAINPASPYISSWLGINILVVMLGFAIIALVYTVGNFLTPSTKERINGITKIEITQLMISLLIIFVLLAFSSTVYSITCNVSSSLASNSITTFSDPFQFATNYIGNLSFGVGLNLYSQVFSASYQMVLTATIFEQIPDLFCSIVKSVVSAYSLTTGVFFCGLAGLKGGLTIGWQPAINLYIVFDSLSFLYLEIFGPILALAIGALFLQYLAIPVIQYMAFAVMLPAALIMRSIPFGGQGLRATANIVLAIAIALYLIYPMTIAFDAWAMHWIYSTANPLSPYLAVIPNSNFSAPNNFLKIIPSGQSVFGYAVPSIAGVFQTLFLGSGFAKTYLPNINPTKIAQQGVLFSTMIAKYVFESIVLFGINLAITIGFAASLADALTKGVEGNASFWASL
jgi:hypothetical protein